MEFRVLGPIEVLEDGRRLAIASGRERALLALLLIHAGQVLSTDRILDAIWGDAAPDSGAKTVAFHISRLRDALFPGRRRGEPCTTLTTEPGGYCLHVDPGDVDADRFAGLALEGRALVATEPASARAHLADALSLWRGEPYADVGYETFAQAEVQRLEELRLGALEDRLEADLALGRDRELIGELESLVTANPLRERLRGQLMTALYRADRQAEALRVYEQGRRLLAEELGIDPSPELERLQAWILQQDVRLARSSQRGAPRNPYKGLRPFGEQDKADFYGREALVARLVERLAEVARAGRLLIVVGPSGSGKSSVVRAGLVPALRAGALPGSEHWPICAMYPGARPFRELAGALAASTGGTEGEVAAALEREDGLTRVLAEAIPGDVPHLVLVIDQFEELFTLVDDAPQQERFLSVLAHALAADQGHLLVVATLRADAFDLLLRSSRFGELVRTGTEVVTPLAPDELERAIARPAQSVGVEFEPGLASEVIADVARRAGELPLLEYALTELFDRCTDRRLTREGYRSVGGVLGALSRRAEETYAALDAEEREVARQVFLRLVSAGDDGRPSPRRASRAELWALSDHEGRVEEVLDRFGRGRLLSFDRDAATGESLVEVAHEALLFRWSRLAGWLDQAREDIRLRRRLSDAVAEWERSGRDASFLLTGKRLDDLAAWAGSTTLRLDGAEQELLDTSAAERRRRGEADIARVERERALERRAATRLRALVAVLALGLVVAVSLTVAVYGQGASAQEQKDVAYSRELAAASIASLDNDLGLSLSLATRAAEATVDRGYVTEEAMYALHWALQQNHVAYPGGNAPVAVRSGPHGLAGVELLPPSELIALASSAGGRSLSAEECRTYLHRANCPPLPSPPTRNLRVYTQAGIVPVAQLAASSLSGTAVDAVSQVPADLAPLLEQFGRQTGITVSLAAGQDDLDAGLASGRLPDVAIVSSPAVVADLAREHRLIGLDGLVDAAAYRSAAGEYLTSLGSVGADGSWPAADGELYGASIATEVSSLIWYPEAAFEQAGYAVPRTWNDLLALARRMADEGRTPWCLGAEAGADSGAAVADIVEDLVLHDAGQSVYDQWTSGRLPFVNTRIRQAFRSFEGLVESDELVLNGVRSIALIPEHLAAWPMLTDPPSCWLHPGAASDRASLPAGPSTKLAVFAFPAADPANADAVRGQAYQVVIFHDRPEVRSFVRYLLSEEFAATATSALVPAGLWPVAGVSDGYTPDAIAAMEHDLLQRSVELGAFRVDATDLMPRTTAHAFSQAMLTYLAWGPSSLDQLLQGIDGGQTGASP